MSRLSAAAAAAASQPELCRNGVLVKNIVNDSLEGPDHPAW